MDHEVAMGMVQDVSDNFHNSISANLSTIDIRLTGNVTALESKLGNLTSQVSITDNITEAVLSELEDNIENLEFQYIFIETGLGNLGSSLTSLESNVGNLESSLTSLDSNVDKLELHVSNIETDLGNLESSLTSLESNVGTLELQVSNIESNVGSLELQVSNIDSNVDNLELHVSDIEFNVGNLESSLTSIETDLGNLDSLFDDTATNLVQYLSNLDTSSSLRGNIQALEAVVPTINTNVQFLFNNIEGDLRTANLDIYNLKHRTDLLEGLNEFEPVFTRVSNIDATLVFRNLQKGTSVTVTITPSDPDNSTVVYTNVYLDTLVVESLEPNTTYTANIGSPNYFTLIEFTTPNSDTLELGFADGNVTMQGPLSGISSQRLWTYVKSDNTTFYSSEIAGTYSGAVIVLDVSGNVTTGNHYVFEVKDVVTDNLVANLEFDV
jgi:predicted  nucleic acid-binding Zn-ribbon protein